MSLTVQNKSKCDSESDLKSYMRNQAPAHTRVQCGGAVAMADGDDGRRQRWRTAAVADGGDGGWRIGGGWRTAGGDEGGRIP